MTFYIKETCPKRGYWCSVRLVDEHGSSSPYAGLGYTFHDRLGESYSGYLDDEGYARIENFYCGPLVLDLSMPYQGLVDPWYDELQIRKHFKIPLTALQVVAEQSPSGPRDNGKTYLAKQRAENEQAEFYQVEVRDFVKPDAAAHLPDTDTSLFPRPSSFLKEVCGRSNQRPGIALMANEHTLLEIKALRAYSPLFSRDKAFCALNAYHLSMMSVLSYAPFHKKRSASQPPEPPPYQVPGCIGAVLHNQLAHLEKPTLFESAGPYHLLCEEVPYSKRLEVVPYDRERYQKEAASGWEYPEQVHFLNDDNDTQGFITHNDKFVIISIRGTAELVADALRDMDARQVPHEDGLGQAHRGFHDAFVKAKEFIDQYMRAFHRKEQTILVCGHSLGGAIALLLAEWLRRKYSDDIQLYTFGSPRAGDSAFVKAAADLPHHRIVNHNDLVPGVPSTWMDAEWKLALPGTLMLVASVGSPLLGAALFLGGLMNLRGDNYEHHGEQWHFMPRKQNANGFSSILWQPGCAAIEQKMCAEFTGDIDLHGDMPKRQGLLVQLASVNQHSSNSGYSRGALTTLLRWHTSVMHRGGELFTERERKKLGGQIEPLQEAMSQPIPLTYVQFRQKLRLQPQPRLEKMGEIELRTLFEQGLVEMETLRLKQKKGLNRAQKRLTAQGQRQLTWQDVFGDLTASDELHALIGEWLDLAENREAFRQAKIQSTVEQHFSV